LERENYVTELNQTVAVLDQSSRDGQRAGADACVLARVQLHFGRHDLPPGQSLLKEPLKTEHIKRRLLGHWGASPALSFVWVHLTG
jgi:phosphoketolase